MPFDYYYEIYQLLLEDNPGYGDIANTLPKKMFSGKVASTRKGIFFCYELPTKRADGTWSDGDGWYRWYLLDPETGNISDDAHEIWKAIRCAKEESRVLTIGEEAFSEAKKKVDSYIKKNYLRLVQAPINEKQRLVTWMQLA